MPDDAATNDVREVIIVNVDKARLVICQLKAKRRCAVLVNDANTGSCRIRCAGSHSEQRKCDEDAGKRLDRWTMGFHGPL